MTRDCKSEEEFRSPLCCVALRCVVQTTTRDDVDQSTVYELGIYNINKMTACRPYKDDVGQQFGLFKTKDAHKNDEGSLRSVDDVNDQDIIRTPHTRTYAPNRDDSKRSLTSFKNILFSVKFQIIVL